MKVDMSSKAVTARLRELDELWLLSVKLANSKKMSPRGEKNSLAQKKQIGEKNPKEIAKSYPLSGLANGWFFRVTEETNLNFLAEGIDLFGRKVSNRQSDPDQALEKCVEYATQISKNE